MPLETELFFVFFFEIASSIAIQYRCHGDLFFFKNNFRSSHFFFGHNREFSQFFSPVREREREREILLVGFSFWLFQDVVDALEIAAQQDGRHGTKKGTAGPVEEEEKEEERPR